MKLTSYLLVILLSLFRWQAVAFVPQKDKGAKNENDYFYLSLVSSIRCHFHYTLNTLQSQNRQIIVFKLSQCC